MAEPSPSTATPHNEPGPATITGFRQQIQRNSVALISLVIAITSLAYNTWRNESSEAHRNLREAGFRILVELGELQQIIDYTAYFHAHHEPANAGDPGQLWTHGWGKVAMIRDLTQLMPEPAPTHGRQLFQHWQQHANPLLTGIQEPQGRHAEQTLTNTIQQTREEILLILKELK